MLSVKTYTKRIEHVKQQLALHGIKAEFVFTYDADEISDADLATTFGPSDLARPHQSLVLKHIHTWRDAVAKGLQRILVFEDDVILASDFQTGFHQAMCVADALAPGYLIFFGGGDTKVPDCYFLSNNILVPLPIATAEAYVTDLPAMNRRLDWLKHNRVTLPADHLIRRIDGDCQIQHYWLRHPIVSQGTVTGLFVSALDIHRQKHSRWFNLCRHHWNKFQRHKVRGWFARLRWLRFRRN